MILVQFSFCQLKCCGAVNFSDYEQVFINFSVPVSCCNTTNPLVNETTCPDIVRDVTNETTDYQLIYTEVLQLLQCVQLSIIRTPGLCFSTKVYLHTCFDRHWFQCCCCVFYFGNISVLDIVYSRAIECVPKKNQQEVFCIASITPTNCQ